MYWLHCIKRVGKGPFYYGGAQNVCETSGLLPSWPFAGTILLWPGLPGHDEDRISLTSITDFMGASRKLMKGSGVHCLGLVHPLLLLALPVLTFSCENVPSITNSNLSSSGKYKSVLEKDLFFLLLLILTEIYIQYS
jgi:hypothetical protein